MIDQLHYGVCFFPEHWPESMIDDDLSRIRDAGMTYVRVGEGAWWYFEPEEGQYRFDLFDTVVSACAKKGLKVVFGTPTYCGPAWIGTKYPEVYRWDFSRTPMKHGSRRNYTYNSPKYNELSDKITTALVEHYKREKTIITWQIDNEFNCHMDTSYAPVDTIAFRAFLKSRYKSLDALNAAWGTKFWSQVYSDWDQIDLPHPTATYNNPTQKLDESRFISDSVVRFCRRQADIVRGVNPKWQITHNGLFGNVDGPALAAELDFFSHDQYPLFYGRWQDHAWGLMQARSLSFPFGLLEQQAGPGGQMSYLHATPRPGQMRLWAYQSFAHGAKMLSYFCWRTCPFGSEQHWHGLIEPDNRDTRRYKEAADVGTEIAELPREVWDAPPEKSFGILRDFDNEVNIAKVNNYVKAPWEPWHWSAELLKNHVPVDLLWASTDKLTGYRVIVAPHFRMLDAALVQKLDSFVRAGGTLVVSAQSGIKDRNVHLVKTIAPGILRKLAGIEVEDWTMLGDKEERLCTLDGAPLPCIGFVERLKCRGAEPLAHWQGEDPLLADAPSITVNEVDRGRVIYIGGYLDERGIAAMVKHLMATRKITPLIDAPAEVEVVARRSAKWRYLWLLNHSAEPQFIERVAGRELLGDTVVEGSLKLKPHGVAIVQVRP